MRHSLCLFLGVYLGIVRFFCASQKGTLNLAHHVDCRSDDGLQTARVKSAKLGGKRGLKRHTRTSSFSLKINRLAFKDKNRIIALICPNELTGMVQVTSRVDAIITLMMRSSAYKMRGELFRACSSVHILKPYGITRLNSTCREFSRTTMVYPQTEMSCLLTVPSWPYHPC